MRQDREEIRERMSDIRLDPPGGEARCFRFGAYRFDPGTRDLWSEGEPVPDRLQPQVADLLEVLLQHEGRVVPREVLYRSLWGDLHVDRKQGLNFLVRQLRIALEDDAGEPGSWRPSGAADIGS